MRGLDGQLARRDKLFSKMLDQFVCVRLVQCYGLDRDLFQFDTDLTMAIFFMNADGTVYGRYGTRAGRDDAAFVHPEGLRKAMQAALGLHQSISLLGDQLRRKLADKQENDTPWSSYEQIPGVKRRVAPAAQDSHKCYHCHWVQGSEILARRRAGKKIDDRHLWTYPMLDVLGAKLDPRSKATVQEVVEASPAGRAGLRRGDEIAELNGQPILSIADVQWVLHRSPDKGTVSALVRRADRDAVEQLTIELPAGWRRHGDISWRAIQWMLRDEALGFHMEALAAKQKRHHHLPADRTVYRVTRLAPGWYKQANHAPQAAGLRKGDLIVAVNDRPPPADMSRFLAWIAQETRPGDMVSLEVVRRGHRKTIRFRMQ